MGSHEKVYLKMAKRRQKRHYIYLQLEARGSLYFQVPCMNLQKAPFPVVSHQAKRAVHYFSKNSQVKPSSSQFCWSFRKTQEGAFGG